MNVSSDFGTGPELDFELWKVTLRTLCGRYNPEGVDPTGFAGSVRPANIWGFAAVDLSCNAHRIERTYHDVRLDSTDHFGAIFQLAGRSTLLHNDRVTDLAVGDIALVDSTLPVTYVSENRSGRWLGLNLSRRSLVSHLGFEPEGGLLQRGETVASRLLFRLMRDAADERDLSYAATEPHMQLVVYDLLGALFAGADLPSTSSHSDKVFMRACGIIKAHFADPNIGPGEIAAEAGISLRYLQKLFTVRGSTCSHLIQSLRLDRAAQLIRHRASMRTGQPLSVIAYGCGFRDYTSFSRAFRRRFGHPPGSTGAQTAADHRATDVG
jgi:AraC family transcriptional activator of tynA and feaB